MLLNCVMLLAFVVFVSFSFYMVTSTSSSKRQQNNTSPSSAAAQHHNNNHNGGGGNYIAIDKSFGARREQDERDRVKKPYISLFFCFHHRLTIFIILR